MMKKLNQYFESMVEISLIRHGMRQRIETLINEEALLLAKYMRDERNTWISRIDCAQGQIVFFGNLMGKAS